VVHNKLLTFQDKRYRYDAFGRMIEKRSAKRGLQRFTYDAESRLIEVRNDNGSVVRMTYDPLGRRIEKTEHDSNGYPLGETRFTWDGLRLLQEHRHQQTSLYLYEDEGYEPLARVDGTGPLQKIRYYHNDLNGLPEQLTEADGHNVWQATYRVWGNTLEEVREPYYIEEQNLRFQGQYLDRETGLHFNTFRFYDPDVGRFTTPDPIGLKGGLNLYQYGHNPVGWVDPWGWSCVQFKRWKRFDAIDKPLPNGKAPAWDVVRSRYWKNRHEASKASGEFSPANMSRMKRGSAPLDANGNSMELHHHNPQRNGGVGVNNPRNLREVTREQHAELDDFRHLGTK
jgi:RHS repeat-associated protein